MRCILFLFTSLPPASPRSIAPTCLLAPFCDFFEAHWIQFALALYSWMCSPPSRAWSTYILNENWLSSWRLSITNSISTSGFMVSPPPPGWGLSLHRPCACCHCYCEFICTTPGLCPEERFSCSHARLLTLSHFPPLSLQRRGDDIDVPLRAKHSSVFYSLHLGGLSVFCYRLI